MFIYLFVIIRFISIDSYVFSRVIVIVWRVLIRVLEIIIVYDLCKIIVVCQCECDCYFVVMWMFMCDEIFIFIMVFLVVMVIDKNECMCIVGYFLVWIINFMKYFKIFYFFSNFLIIFKFCDIFQRGVFVDFDGVIILVYDFVVEEWLIFFWKVFCFVLNCFNIFRLYVFGGVDMEVCYVYIYVVVVEFGYFGFDVFLILVQICQIYQEVVFDVVRVVIVVDVVVVRWIFVLGIEMFFFEWYFWEVEVV